MPQSTSACTSLLVYMLDVGLKAIQIPDQPEAGISHCSASPQPSAVSYRNSAAPLIPDSQLAKSDLEGARSPTGTKSLFSMAITE